MSTGKPFRVSYTNNKTGEQVVNERPRVVITADGKHKCLFLDDGTVVASVAFYDADDFLWRKGRENLRRTTLLNTV